MPILEHHQSRRLRCVVLRGPINRPAPNRPGKNFAVAPLKIRHCPTRHAFLALRIRAMLILHIDERPPVAARAIAAIRGGDCVCSLLRNRGRNAAKEQKEAFHHRAVGRVCSSSARSTSSVVKSAANAYENSVQIFKTTLLAAA